MPFPREPTTGSILILLSFLPFKVVELYLNVHFSIDENDLELYCKITVSYWHASVACENLEPRDGTRHALTNHRLPTPLGISTMIG